MKNFDTILLGIVALVWAMLALMYATIPMINMPNGVRVWGLGAVLFVILTAIGTRGRRSRE